MLEGSTTDLIFGRTDLWGTRTVLVTDVHPLDGNLQVVDNLADHRCKVALIL